MRQEIIHVALLVKNYDEAIAFYKDKLGFILKEDKKIDEDGKRWVIMTPPGSTGTSILLAKASKQEQESFIGNQTGGRVFLFLQTDDFWRDYNSFVSKDIIFIRKPQEMEYGLVAVFTDLYGNFWDLIQLQNK